MAALSFQQTNAQRSTAIGDLQQAINIGMRARSVHSICSVFGEHSNAMCSSFRVQGPKILLKILIDDE
jgi:hypothetical protein